MTTIPHTHQYLTDVVWTGSTGVGYDAYERGHTGTARPAAAVVDLSSDPSFRGDPARLNPEQLLVLAASSCQLLSFLAIAARARVDVIAYTDHAVGEMPEGVARMSITRITLRPEVVIAVPAPSPETTPETTPDTTALEAKVHRLLHLAHEECYIASSLRTEILLEPTLSFVFPLSSVSEV